jgi:nitrite reductase (NO-forming)
MDKTGVSRRHVIGMVAAAPLVVAACSDDGGSSAIAVSGGDGGIDLATVGTPEMVPLADLQDADSSEVHASYAPETPPTTARNTAKKFSVDLEVVEGVCPLDPTTDTTTQMWGYRIDGDTEVSCGSPGPVLRGRVGDVARITLTNPSSSEHPHNIDFHAVTGQGGGAADLTVAPGEQATIQARLLYPGAFMYHCAFGDVPEHIAKGMYGMFIVDPEVPLPETEHEWAVMQSEWFVGEAGADGEAPFDRQAVTDESPSYITFNGRTDALQDDNALTMNVGDRARIYMVNEGLNLDSNFHPIGSHWDVVYPEAATHPDNRVIRGSQSTLVVAGGGTVVEVVGLVPSTILLVDHALARAFDKGAIAHLVVDGEPDAEIFSSSGISAAAAGAGATAAAEDEPEEEELALVEADEVTIPDGAFDPANADTAFSPKDIRTAVGTEVTWTNADSVFHTITSGESNGTIGTADGIFDSGNVEPGETFSYTFDTSGTFPYFCTPHPWMRGTVVVEEA